MIRRPPRSTQGVSSAASDVYKRQVSTQSTWDMKIENTGYSKKSRGFNRDNFTGIQQSSQYQTGGARTGTERCPEIWIPSAFVFKKAQCSYCYTIKVGLSHTKLYGNGYS
eukprot:TRINITY_DN26573_c0_g1_i2.p1 TRINITY_DN26573_c0_g1~~TRINITY_DN26573_c0_g1_i2.p1  ORF type:complete len:110 (+),score=23.30 TRINITY_DN26573_c0_g1_i2:111-440(+)